MMTPSTLETVGPSLFAAAAAVEDFSPEAAGVEAAGAATFGFHIRQHVMEASAALRAKIPGVVELDVKLGKKVIAYDVMLDAREKVTVLPDGEILLTPYSAGLRIGVKLSEFRADLKLNLYAVALAASVGMVNTESFYGLYGIPSGIGDVPQPDVLNREKGLEEVLAFILKVKSSMAEKPDQVRLIELPTVSLGRRGVTVLDNGHSTVFAMRQIRMGRTLREALDASVGLGFDPDIIRASYQSMLEHFSDDRAPTAAQSRAAGEWLDV